MGEDSQEVKLAVAVNDIAWMKSTLEDVNEGFKDLKESLETHNRLQDEKYATKSEVADIRKDVENLKAWRWKIAGGIVFAGAIVGWAMQGLQTWFLKG